MLLSQAFVLPFRVGVRSCHRRPARRCVAHRVRRRLASRAKAAAAKQSSRFVVTATLPTTVRCDSRLLAGRVIALSSRCRRRRSGQNQCREKSNARQHARVPPCDETASGLRRGTAIVVGTRSRLALASHRHEPIHSFQRTLLALPLLCRLHRSEGLRWRTCWLRS